MVFLRAFVFVLASLWLQAAVAAAPSNGFGEKLTGWQQTLHHSEDVLARDEFQEAEIETLQIGLGALIDEARAHAVSAEGSAAITRQMVDALGIASGENAPPEADAVVRERQRLSANLAELTGQVRQAELVATRADILLRTANERRLEQFTQTLLLRGPSPLAPSSWAQLPDQLPFLRDRVAGAFWMAVEQADGSNWLNQLAKLGVLAILSFGVALPLRGRLLRRHGHRAMTEAPTYRQKAIAAAVEALARGLMPVVPTIAVAAGLLALLGSQPTRILAAVITTTATGLVFYFFCSGFCRALLAPDHPSWRLTDLTADSATRLGHRVRVFAAMLAAAGAVILTLETLLTPPELEAIFSFAGILVGAAALFSLLPNRLWRREHGAVATAEAIPAARDPLDPGDGTTTPAMAPPGAWRRLRLLAGLIGLTAVVACSFGFLNLSLYIARLFLVGAAVAGMLLLVRGVLLEVAELVVGRPDSPLARARQNLVQSERSRKAFDFAARLILDMMLVLIGLGVVLPTSGIEWSELKSWVGMFMRGVSVGGITIAPADILAAVVVVTVGILLTRFIQRQLDERVLQRLQLDRGVQHSVRTGIGYLGVIIALLLGVGALGLDLSNLALIAGALSVGIGFGLQTVVSNFVAGLILLVERPIKVGDWVVVGDKEGMVKRISVRATEVQTFQRASIIIPNSELVSSAVVNWTYKDKFGRVDIKVGVDYGSDLKKVREVLLKCAGEHQRVIRVPPPVVVFRDFGASSLDFELRCFIADVDHYLTVSSDLRFAIADAFEAQGISIPYNQQVLHIPQLETISDLLTTRKAAPVDGATPVLFNPAGSPAKVG